MDLCTCFADAAGSAHVSASLKVALVAGIIMGIYFTYVYFCIIELNKARAQQTFERKQRIAVEALKPQKGDADGKSESKSGCE